MYQKQNQEDNKMCIVCNNQILGLKYIDKMAIAVQSLKECESILLMLSNIKNIEFEPREEKAKRYNHTHKKLVKIRKSLGEIELMRENNKVHNEIE